MLIRLLKTLLGMLVDFLIGTSVDKLDGWCPHERIRVHSDV